MPSFALAVAAALGGVVVPLTTASATSAFMDFEGLNTGTVCNTQYVATAGVTVSCDNYNPAAGHPDKCVIFNSALSNTADADLEWDGMWSAGNIKNVALGKFMTIAENDVDTSPANGLIDSPDDEADGGTIFLKFTTPQRQFGFDLIDIELHPEIDHVDFLLRGVLFKSVTFDKFALAGPFHRNGIVYADRSANRIAPITSNDMNGSAFDEVRFYLPECGAIDNLTFSDTAPAVPEPATASVLALAGAGWTLIRRRPR